MLKEEDLQKIFESRPFKVRNADEFDLNSVIDLFVDPTDGLRSPFDFENSIIKGRMGSGKTMYLRANLAYYLYTLVPCLLEGKSIILPIYIRLSDFHGMSTPEQIYKAIIIKIVDEMTTAYMSFQDSKKLGNLHKGVQSLLSSNSYYKDIHLEKMVGNLSLLSADEYIERTTDALTGKGGVKTNFCNLSAECNKTVQVELKKKANPGISDIESTYDVLLKPFDGKLLLLIDEAGSLNKSFFRVNEDISMFEVLMNQLRTLNFIRTKVAVYPQSYSDVLPETRYGDAVLLQEDIKEERGYNNFLNRAVALIEKYIAEFSGIEIGLEEVFSLDNNNMDVLEQIIHASDGNARRLVHLLDLAQNAAYKANLGLDRINISHVQEALREHANSLEKQFSHSDIEFLHVISSTCKARSTYMFKFPNKSIDLQRYTNKSSEYNIINLIEPGSGRKSSVYSFDYAYAFYKDIPTHYIKGTERIDKTRSRSSGQWIEKITTINDNIIEHAQIIGKIEGKVQYVGQNSSGLIIGEDNKEYFFLHENIIENDRYKNFRIGSKMRFLPYKDEKYTLALYVEIL